MKTVVEINLGNFGSTGSIMKGIAEQAEKAGISVYMAFPGGEKNLPLGPKDILICSAFYKKVVRLLAERTGFNGCFSVLATIRFLHKLNRLKPDLLHFHNLHDSYINLPLLFKYVKKHQLPVIWTLHDCWSFTGRCPHFVSVGCDKWITGCHDCPQLNTYPVSKIDRSKYLWKHKKEWFCGIAELTIVTPSKWLAGLVKQSYLKDYPVEVINNGIDLTVFKPTLSTFREEMHLENKYIILGIAFEWSNMKGLDVFVKLAETLDEKYKIILIGTDEKIENQLPNNIISIRKTNNKKELIEIYSAADVFLNPTRQDTFPTVNMEALACGTPIVTFNTGGSPEIIDETCGIITDEDTANIVNAIQEIIEMDSEENCLKRSKQYDKIERFNDYVKLYKSTIN